MYKFKGRLQEHLLSMQEPLNICFARINYKPWLMHTGSVRPAAGQVVNAKHTESPFKQLNAHPITDP